MVGFPMLFVSAAGCTDIQSSDLKTAGMSTTMQVSADGTGQTFNSTP